MLRRVFLRAAVSDFTGLRGAGLKLISLIGLGGLVNVSAGEIS